VPARYCVFGLTTRRPAALHQLIGYDGAHFVAPQSLRPLLPGGGAEQPSESGVESHRAVRGEQPDRWLRATGRPQLGVVTNTCGGFSIASALP